jgi:hypothetical protein
LLSPGYSLAAFAEHIDNEFTGKIDKVTVELT